MFFFNNLTPKFTTISEARRLTGVAYLGGINISAKVIKNQKVSGHQTYIIYLAPASSSGYNLCSHSTPERRNGCLATSGRARMELASGGTRIQQSRIKKARTLIEHPDFYLNWLFAEIEAVKAKAKRDGFEFSVRLNGTSDVDYTKLRVDGVNVFERFSDVIFYDYTKDSRRFASKPANLQLTLSYTGRNWDKCEAALKAGNNVAMIFNIGKKEPLPAKYAGYPVIDGDLTDLRVDEGNGIIIGLYWKNIADKRMNDTVKRSIFVIQPNDDKLNTNLKRKYAK